MCILNINLICALCIENSSDPSESKVLFSHNVVALIKSKDREVVCCVYQTVLFLNWISCLPPSPPFFSATAIVSVCDSSPCLNGATCLNQGPNLFKCVCAHGFKGKNCESKCNVKWISKIYKFAPDNKISLKSLLNTPFSWPFHCNVSLICSNLKEGSWRIKVSSLMTAGNGTLERFF